MSLQRDTPLLQASTFESISEEVFISSVAAITVSVVFFTFRVISRSIEKRGFKSSDYVLLAGLLCQLALNGLSIWSSRIGLGDHIAILEVIDPSLSNVTTTNQLFFASSLLYYAAISCVKISALLHYREVSSSAQFKYATVVVGAVISAWWTSFSFATIFGCSPIRGFWDPSLHSAHCVDKYIVPIANAASDIVTNVIVLCLPLKVVWGAGRGHKFALVLPFLLGCLACAAAIIRLRHIIVADLQEDTTWSFANLTVWSTAEVGAAFAAVCLLAAKPLALAITPSRLQNLSLSSFSSSSHSPHRSGTPSTEKRFGITTKIVRAPSGELLEIFRNASGRSGPAGSSSSGAVDRDRSTLTSDDRTEEFDMDMEKGVIRVTQSGPIFNWSRQSRRTSMDKGIGTGVGGGGSDVEVDEDVAEGSTSAITNATPKGILKSWRSEALR